MSVDDLALIHQSLEAGDKVGARVLLRPLLNDQADADLWVLAAYACDKPDRAISCLKKALVLDMHHNEANRLLLRLEGAKPAEAMRLETAERERVRAELNTMLQYVGTPDTPLKKAKRIRRKPGPWRVVFVTGFFLLALSCSLFTMNMIGVINGLFGAVIQLSGGPTPVQQWRGVPLAEVPDAPLVIPPAQSEPLEGRDTDVLDPGYAHEYTFVAQRGDEMAIYVQFLSLDAHAVSHNVAIVRPDGTDATGDCERNHILQGDSGVTYLCSIEDGGTWAVRVLGRDDESIGVYFVGVERVDGM
jgi:hypothetical protein